MSWNPSDVLRVECVETTDPKQVNIVLLNEQSFHLDYALYQLIQEPLGLPDIIC